MSDIPLEIEFLKKIAFLPKDTKPEGIILGSYSFPEFAEIFWRRKKQHARRPDPEIEHIKKANVKNILEIGCAYGRFTRKILEISQDHQISVTGIELIKEFVTYKNLYKEEFPDLDSCRFIYDSILNAKQYFKEEEFDLIVIPMHTFENFTIGFIKELLEIISYLLTFSGIFLFSVNRKRGLEERKTWFFHESYSGELQVEKNKDPIASIAYSYPGEEKEYGYQTVHYAVYYFMNKEMIPQRKIITRYEHDIFLQGPLLKLLEKYGFIVNDITEETYSIIYSLSKKASAI